MRLRKHLLWSGCAAALLLGCRPVDPILGEKVYESENFEVYASEELIACEGTFPAMESWLGSFRARLGEHARGAHHKFFWLNDEDYAESTCPQFTNGCARLRSDYAYSRSIPLPHEVVHLELSHSKPPDFLREGAAEVFGSAGELKSLTEPVEVEALFEPFLDPETYAEAGKFSRYLLDEFGDDAYFELYRKVPRDARRARVDEVMRDVLGVSLDDVLDGYAGFASVCHLENWRSFDYECGDMPLLEQTSEGDWFFSLGMGCDDASVVGPREGRIWTRRALEIEEAGRYEISLVSSDKDADARLRLVSCDEPCEPGAWLKIDITGTAWRGLLPGRHWFEVSLAEGSEADIEVRISRFF